MDENGLPADAAIINDGGFSGKIEAGDFSRLDIDNVMPFEDEVRLLEVKGADLLEVLEAATYALPKRVSSFPQIAGMEIEIDTNKEYDEGEKYPSSIYHSPSSINRVTIKSINGEAFDENAMYKVATVDYLAEGGDCYYPFSQSKCIEDSGILINDVVVVVVVVVFDVVEVVVVVVVVVVVAFWVVVVVSLGVVVVGVTGTVCPLDFLPPSRLLPSEEAYFE